MTLHSFVVAFLIWPSCILFLIMLIPIPFVSRLVSKIVLKVESVQIANVSLLLVFSVLALVNTAQLTYKWRSKMQDVDPKQLALDPSLQQRVDQGRFKLERDLYIAMTAFVLLAALMKTARKHMELHSLNGELKARISAAKKNN